MAIKNANTNNIFKYFEEICNIPHGSGNEKELSDYLLEFAKKRDLEVHQDDAFNIIIKKDGTDKDKKSETVILQSHMDMVCEKNADTIHDFEKDPIKTYIEDDFIKTKGTTLGADNGIAIAMTLELLDSSNINHPPIEALFTTLEETGMNGAMALDTSLLAGKLLINMDTEEEGELVTSCAGGMRVDISFAKEYQPLGNNFSFASLDLKGLTGGHSGTDIDKERANANKLLARALNILLENFDIKLCELSGGIQDNAIPREAVSILAAKNEDFENISRKISEIESIYKNELRVNEVDVSLSFTKIEACSKVLTDELSKKIIGMILLLPNGIQSRSLEIANLVESSNNIGVVKTLEDEIKISNASRSSTLSKRYFMEEQMKILSNILGAACETRSSYPGWEYRPNSVLREVFIKTFEEVYKNKPKISAIHAGLECGLLLDKKRDLDAISFGPNIYFAHTPKECVSISSVDRTWNYLLAVLNNLI